MWFLQLETLLVDNFLFQGKTQANHCPKYIVIMFLTFISVAINPGGRKEQKTQRCITMVASSRLMFGPYKYYCTLKQHYGQSHLWSQVNDWINVLWRQRNLTTVHSKFTVASRKFVKLISDAVFCVLYEQSNMGYPKFQWTSSLSTQNLWKPTSVDSRMVFYPLSTQCNSSNKIMWVITLIYATGPT